MDNTAIMVDMANDACVVQLDKSLGSVCEAQHPSQGQRNIDTGHDRASTQRIGRKDFTRHEIVTLAVYLLGGDAQKIDTEDIAKKANELALGRFTWRKYPDQINIENVRTFLSDAKKAKNGGYLLGAGKDGWILTNAGLSFSKMRVSGLDGLQLSRKAMNSKRRNWMRRERERMLGSEAYQKFSSGEGEKITTQEAQAFFRIDAYVIGAARSLKLLRAATFFGGDPQLEPLIRLLTQRVVRDGHSALQPGRARREQRVGRLV